MDIRRILLTELGTDGLTEEIELDMESVCQHVRNYCNLADIPEDLNFTIADMVLDLQRAKEGGNLAVSEVKMGDTAYTFALDKAVQGVLKDYRAQLNTFRKLRW